MVSIAGGEPLLHKEINKVVEGIIARRKFVYLCTNALLLKKKLSLFKPSPYFVWSVHLDGDEEMHDRSVCETGVYDRAVAAIKEAKAKGFRVNINCTLFNDADPERVARFFDSVKAMGVDGITVSPGYAYERAPDQAHFLNRAKTKQLFRDIFKRGHGGKAWSFSQSGLFLDFLAGNQEYKCTPWGNPTRTVFGWQRPCYLLGEGYAHTFRELMDETDWDLYGTGNYEKCADCMVHSGFEATAVQDAVRHPLKAFAVNRRGVTGGWGDGPRDSARAPASGAIRVLTARRPEAVGNPGDPGPDQGVDGRVTARATAVRVSIALRSSSGSWPGHAQQRSEHRAPVDGSIGAHAAERRRRERPCHRVGDHPEHRERNVVRRPQMRRRRATRCPRRARRSPAQRALLAPVRAMIASAPASSPRTAPGK